MTETTTETETETQDQWDGIPAELLNGAGRYDDDTAGGCG